MKGLAAVHPQPLSPSPPRRLVSSAVGSIRLSVARTPLSYSTTKLLALQAYYGNASCWRVVAVLVLTPVPALLGSVLPSLVPLQDPLLGFARNHAMIAHGFLLVSLASFGTIMLTLGATATPRHMYSETRAVVISAVSAAIVLALASVLCSSWRFPVPFFIITAGPLWVLALGVTHVVLLRDNLRRYPQLGPSLARYCAPFAMQISQFTVYSLLTVVFDRVSPIYQVVMVLVFPLIKLMLKHVLRRYTKALDEMGGEVAVSTVEICASLYQSMIMQSSQSTLALCAIMGIDAIQGLIAIKYFVGRQVTTPHRELFPRAFEILRQRRDQRIANGTSKADRAADIVVNEALSVASAIDSVLLIEYFEVSVPIVNTFFLLVSYRSTSTLYNTRLNAFYRNTDLVVSSTSSVLLYAALQAVSMLVFQWALRTRHNVSAWRHLAFVLEYHARSIQGKLLVFFVLVFYFTLIHYGTDFTLRFDFPRLVQGFVIRPS